MNVCSMCSRVCPFTLFPSVKISKTSFRWAGVVATHAFCTLSGRSRWKVGMGDEKTLLNRYFETASDPHSQHQQKTHKYDNLTCVSYMKWHYNAECLRGAQNALARHCRHSADLTKLCVCFVALLRCGCCDLVHARAQNPGPTAA